MDNALHSTVVSTPMRHGLPIDADAVRLIAAVSQATAQHVGERLLQTVVDDLAELLGARIAFIARPVDDPPTRVQVVACNLRDFHQAFDLANTPCELIYAGRPVAIESGVFTNFPPARETGCESFFGTPFFDAEQKCIGHLGLFFPEPRQLPEPLTQALENIAIRLEGELQRLDLTTRLENSRRRLDFQNRILKLAASHVALDQVLEHLILGIEAENADMICSIMRPDSDGKRLSPVAAPSLPPEYALALHNVRIFDGAGSCGTAAFTGQRMITRDIGDHPYWDNRHGRLAVANGLRSCWSQPVTSAQGELLAVFAIYRRYPGEPTTAELELIDSVSALCSLVIDNYRTLDELQLRTLKYQHFLQTSPDGMVVLDLEGRFIEISDGFLQQIGASQRAEVENTRIWDWDAKNDEQACRRRLCELIDHPVLYETRNRRVDGTHWNAEVSAKAFQVNGQTLIWASSRDITERKRMERELTRRATTDDLTGLLNRPTFMSALSTEFQRSQRHGRPLTVLMLDIDYFKKINDTHGHQAGDAVLREIAGVFRTHLRTGDVVGRIGGEEFAFILPETGTLGARDAAEKIRQTVAAHAFQIIASNGQSLALSVTCSIGLAIMTGAERNHEELLSLADGALYEAKAAGRDRVCTAIGIG